MPARERRIERGEDRARRLLMDAGRELRMARLQHGLGLDSVGRAARLSPSTVSRIERGLLPTASAPVLGRLAAAVGLELSLRMYPHGEPIRDAAHGEVIGWLRVLLHPVLGWRLEVPFPESGDRRAWDAVIQGRGWRAGVEVETRVRDLQSLLRRVGIKQRDGGVDLVLLVLASTRHNRAIVRSHAADLVASFPAPAKETMERLAAGVRPAGSSLLLLGRPRDLRPVQTSDER